MALSLRSLRDLPPMPGATVCRADWRWALVRVAALGAVVGGCVWTGVRGGVAFGRGGALPGVIAWWCAAWLGFVCLWMANDLRKMFDPDAWLAVVGPDALHVKCRSFRNRHFGRDDLQVVSIPYESITSARRHRRTWTTRNRDGGDTTERRNFVELDLGDTDTEPLRQMLARERTLPPRRGRWSDYPVSVEPGNLVRIEWVARPSAAVFLETLRQRGVRIDPPVASDADLTRSSAEEDVRELARRGDRMGLVRVLREREGLDLTAARARAEAMVGEARGA